MPKRLSIVCYPDAILRRKTKYIKKFGPSVTKLGEQMLSLMWESDGIGLAAPQVGISKKLIVVDVGAEEGPLMLANPKVVGQSEATESFVEGCLSLPEIEGPVVRPLEVRVSGQSLEDGEELEIEAGGLLARCLQHEIDHLNCQLFIDHLSPRNLHAVESDLRELERRVA